MTSQQRVPTCLIGNSHLGKPSYKKKGKKKDNVHTDKLTTKCHICLHTWKQGSLICGIWDWQSTIVKDLNDSQDPKHTLFCREIVFVAIYALFSDNKCPLFTRLGGGSPKADIVRFFYRFSHRKANSAFFAKNSPENAWLSLYSSKHDIEASW